MTTARLCGLAAGASLLLAGCGGGNGDSTAESATTVDGIRVLQTIVVHETDFALEPKTLRAERFGYYGIEVVNDGDVPHALAVEGHGVDERTRELEPGESQTLLVLLTKGGTYRVYCPVDGHEAQGMRATLEVHSAG
jgi:uncharacterized cupredoxin-like copper-binding protein